MPFRHHLSPAESRLRWQQRFEVVPYWVCVVVNIAVATLFGLAQIFDPGVLPETSLFKIAPAWEAIWQSLLFAGSVAAAYGMRRRNGGAQAGGWVLQLTGYVLLLVAAIAVRGPGIIVVDAAVLIAMSIPIKGLYLALNGGRS